MPHSDRSLDQYSSYEYKPMFEGGAAAWNPVSWVPEDQQRRLRAYHLLASYLENSARLYLQNDLDPDSRREYGDPSLIVDSLADAVIGDEARVSVEGARHRQEPDEYADTLQDWFEVWVEDDRLHMTVMEVERDSIGLGDGIYVVGWDAKKRRPTVTTYDPGFYFPVLDPRAIGDEYPKKVHLAWEFEEEEPRTRTKKRYVRRITYELVQEPGRRYPWDPNSGEVCLMSDGVWAYDRLGSYNWLDLDERGAEWQIAPDGREIRNLDIGVDFIPVVHLPNTISRKEHFGRSSLQKILQIIDDLQNADTDLLKSARTTGSPPLGTESVVEVNEDGGVDTYGPGEIIQGKITVIDTSRNLDAMLKYCDWLLKRLSTNSRIPESVLGKLRPSEVPSGIALALSFGPLRSLVRQMRLARHEKYPLLFKFVHRFAMLDPENSDLVPSTDRVASVPMIEYTFGQFLPSDRTIIIESIINLFREGLLSRNTAIKLLIEDAGMDIADAEGEVTAIEHEDVDGANTLREALDSPEAAAEYLARTIPAMSEARRQAVELEIQSRGSFFGNSGDSSSSNGNAQPAGQAQ